MISDWCSLQSALRGQDHLNFPCQGLRQPGRRHDPAPAPNSCPVPRHRRASNESDVGEAVLCRGVAIVRVDDPVSV